MIKKLPSQEALSVHAHLDLPKKSRNGEVQLLIFSLGLPVHRSVEKPSLFAINIFKIREVIKRYEWIAPPQDDERLFGLLSLRGEWIPIMNTFHATNTQAATSSAGHTFPLVLVEYGRRLYGFLIENILGIDQILWKDIHSIHSSREDSALVTGVGQSKKFGSFMILDIDQCITNVFPDVVDIETQSFAMSLVLNKPDQYVGCRVYLADDSSVMRKHLTQALELLRVNVHTFENGQYLLNKLLLLKQEQMSHGHHKFYPYSMVITDIEMPEMDGISLVRKLKSDPFYADTCMIIYSSLSVVTSRQIGIDVGADDVIQKLNTATLMKTVMTHLDRIIKTPL